MSRAKLLELSLSITPLLELGLAVALLFLRFTWSKGMLGGFILASAASEQALHLGKPGILLGNPYRYELVEVV